MSAPESPTVSRPGIPGRQAPRRALPEVAGVEVEHQWVDAGGLRTHIALAGDPQAPPLLCVHGWPQHWYMWRNQIPALAERYRVICPDLRGFGWSEAPGSGNDPITFSEDLAALLDALGIERTRVLGHDWGGFASYFLACNRPERVERLVTLNIVPPFVRVGPRALLSAWRFWYQWAAFTPFLGAWMMRNLDSPKGALRRMAYGDADFSGGAIESYSDQFRERDRLRGAQRLYRHAAFRFVPSITLRRFDHLKLEVPTRLIWGLNDMAQSASLLNGLERRYPTLEIERVEGAGHFIAEERPKLVTERALDFLAG